MQEVRFGRTHHHNEAIGEDYLLKTSEQLGIKGINLNDFTSGITTIDVGGYSDYLIGFETSLPWNREESTMDGVDDRHEDVGQSHGESRWRPALEPAPSGPGESSSRALPIPRQPDGAQHRHSRSRTATRIRSRRSCWTCRTGLNEASSRSPTTSRFIAVARTRLSTRTSRTNGRFGLISLSIWDCAMSCTCRSSATHRSAGRPRTIPSPTRISVAGYGDIPEDLGVETIWKNFNPRTGISWRPNDTTVVRAGYGVSALGLPSSWGQAYPIRQVQQISPANSFAPTAFNLTTGMPLPALPPIPAVRHPRRHAAARRSPRYCSQRQDRGHAALVQRRVSARPSRRVHGGNCLCRQSGPRHPRGLQHERGSRRRRRPCRPAAVRAVSEDSRHVGPAAGQVRVQLDADQGRPPHAKRLAAHQLVHVGTRVQLRQWRWRRDDLDAGRLGARLSADDVRLDAQLRQQLRLHASRGDRTASG